MENNKKKRGQLEAGPFFLKPNKRPLPGRRIPSNNTNNTNNQNIPNINIPKQLRSPLIAGTYYTTPLGDVRVRTKPVTFELNVPKRVIPANNTRPSKSKIQIRRITPINSVRVQGRALSNTPRNIRNITNNDILIDNDGETNLNVFEMYIIRRGGNILTTSEEILFREQTLFYVVNRIQVAVDQLHDISRITESDIKKAVTRSILIAMYDSIITYIINNGFLNYANQIISASLGLDTQFLDIRGRNNKDSKNALDLFRKKYGPKERYMGFLSKQQKYPKLGNDLFSVIMFLFGREFGETSYRPWLINSTLIELFAVFREIPIQENKVLSLDKSRYVNKTDYNRFIKDIDNIQDVCLRFLGCKVISSFEYSILMNNPSSSSTIINFLNLVTNGIISRDLYITVDALQSSATWNSFSEIFRYYIFKGSNPNKFKIYFVNSAAGLYDSASFNNVIYKYPEFVQLSGTRLTSTCWNLDKVFIKFNNYRINNTGEFNIYMEPYYILEDLNMLYDPGLKIKYDLLYSDNNNNQFPRILNNNDNPEIDPGNNRILFSGKLTVNNDYTKARLFITKFFDIQKLSNNNTISNITNSINERNTNPIGIIPINNNDSEEEVIIKLENNQKASLNVILGQKDVKELISNVNTNQDISNNITDLVYYFAYKTMGDILKGFIHKTFNEVRIQSSNIFLTTDSYSSMFIKSFFNINTILGKRGNSSIVSTMNYILDNNQNNNNNNNNNQMEFGKKKFIQRANEESQKKGTVGSFRRYCKRKLNINKVNKKCIQLAKKSKNKKIRKKAVFAENIRGYYNSFGMDKEINKLETMKKYLSTLTPELIEQRKKELLAKKEFVLLQKKINERRSKK